MPKSSILVCFFTRTKPYMLGGCLYDLFHICFRNSCFCLITVTAWPLRILFLLNRNFSFLFFSRRFILIRLHKETLALNVEKKERQQQLDQKTFIKKQKKKKQMNQDHQPLPNLGEGVHQSLNLRAPQ